MDARRFRARRVADFVGARAAGAVMRLDFDFKGGGGFVVARKPFTRSMPENYVISFAIRGRRAQSSRAQARRSDRP